MNATLLINEVVAALNAIVGRMEDFVPVFDRVGEMVVADVRNRIIYTKVTPEGDPWAPWKPMTADLRDWKGNCDRGILWDEGYLLNSIRADIDGSFQLDIGSDMPYAEDTQYGIQGKQEARPFLGWTGAEIADVNRISRSWVELGVI